MTPSLNGAPAARPTWLVTGATGLLGANAGRWLGARAHRVGLARSQPPAGLFDESLIIDLLDEHRVAGSVEATRPDVILHAAALATHEACEADPQLAHRMNVNVAQLLAAQALRVGARFVHISTDAVFDGAKGNYSESDEPSPFSVYGESKLAGERAVFGANPEALVIRTNFFGWSPSGTRSILEFFVNNLRANQRVRGYDDFIVTSLYAPHLLEAIWNLHQTSATGVIHVASHDALSKFDFGLRVADTFDLDRELIERVSASVAGHATSRARDLSLDTSRAMEALGHRMPSQAEGVRAAERDEARATWRT